MLPGTQLGLCLPSQNPGPRCCLWPVDTRGHRAPILGAGLGPELWGWQVARCWDGGHLLGVGAARLWPVQGQGQRHQPPRQSWPRRGGPYLTHVHKYSSEGEGGGEGALLLSGGSRAGHVCGVLREPHMGLPRREVGWFPLVMEGTLHTSSRGRGVFGVQCAWGRRPPTPVRGRWQGVPVLPRGTSGQEGHTPPPHSTCMSQICVGLSSATSQMMAWSRS